MMKQPRIGGEKTKEARNVASAQRCPHCYQLIPPPVIAHHGLEACGLLRSLEFAADDPDFVVATIGACRVVQKAEHKDQLQAYVGRKIGVLMIDSRLVISHEC